LKTSNISQQISNRNGREVVIGYPEREAALSLVFMGIIGITKYLGFGISLSVYFSFRLLLG
jgi:hypothetical protein